MNRSKQISYNDTMAKAIVVLSLFLSIVSYARSEIVTIGNAKYFISSTKANWYEAGRICKAEHGMVLVDILNEKENECVAELLRPFMDNPDARYWTSGTDLGSEGTFYWASSGHSMLYNNFHPIQPDNWAGNENCVEISRNYEFKWNDDNCNDQLYFICRNTVSYPLNNCICLNA